MDLIDRLILFHPVNIMRLFELYRDAKKPNLIDMLNVVLPNIQRELNLKHLPKIELEKRISPDDQPTFGKYVNDEDTVYLAIDNRHPVDVIRTLAHELVHYKQDMKHQLGTHSGDTGSSEENQAHEIAGKIMRHIDKRYPNFLNLDNIELP